MAGLLLAAPLVAAPLLAAPLVAAAPPALAPAALAAPSPVQPSAGTDPGAVRVSMKDFAFSPVSTTIHAGQAVVWTYDESPTDPMPNCETVALQLPGSPVRCPGHSTTADSNGSGGTPLWDSGVKRAAGFPYSVRFLTPGTYAYHCTVHGGKNPNNPATHMNGTVVVLAAEATPVPAPRPVAAPPSAAPTTAMPTHAVATLPLTGAAPGRALVGLVLAAAAALLTARRRIRRAGG